MALIKIKVPDYWPDFVVTSYYRPGDPGAHGKYRAIDISPRWSGPRDPKSPYWFIYFQTAFLLWGAQRHGKIYIAQPPYCPHIHIDTIEGVSRMGVEFTKPDAAGNCRVLTDSAGNALIYSVDRLSIIENTQFMKHIENDVGKPYLLNWAQVYQDYKYKFSSNVKYITVLNNGQIGESDLQTKLDSIFGDGSTSQWFLDNVAQLANYTNAGEAGKAIGGLGLLGVFALAAYFLMQHNSPDPHKSSGVR